MIYTLVCTDTGEAIHWQCELLEYTWSKYRQKGELIRLVAARDDEPLPVHRHARVIRTQYTNIDPESGDEYPPYNRLYSMHEWLLTEKPVGTVLFLDPDMVFRDTLNKEVQPGRPIGQHSPQPALVYEISPTTGGFLGDNSSCLTLGADE